MNKTDFTIVHGTLLPSEQKNVMKRQKFEDFSRYSDLFFWGPDAQMQRNATPKFYFANFKYRLACASISKKTNPYKSNGLVWSSCYSLCDTQMKNPNLWSHCMRVVCLNFSKLKLIILRSDKSSFIQDFPCYIDCASYKFKCTHIRLHTVITFFFVCMTSSHVSPCLVHICIFFCLSVYLCLCYFGWLLGFAVVVLFILYSLCSLKITFFIMRAGTHPNKIEVHVCVWVHILFSIYFRYISSRWSPPTASQFFSMLLLSTDPKSPTRLRPIHRAAEMV